MNNQIQLTVLLSVFIALLGIGIIIPVLPLFATELGATGMGLSMIIAAFSVSRSLLQPLVGSWSDKLGRKGFLITGLIVYGLVGLLIPLAQNVPHLVIVRAFHGFGSAMIVPIAMAYMGSLSPLGQEGRYMGRLNIAIFCGIGCGPVIGGIISDFWGLSSVFHVMTWLSFIAALLVIRYMPGSTPGEKSKTGQQGLIRALGKMVRRRRTRGILLARFGTMVMMVPTMALLPILMSPWPDNNGLKVGVVIAGRTLVNALLQVPFGRCADRFNKVWLLILGSLVMGTAIISIPLATDFFTIIGIYMVLGAGEAIIWPVLGAWATEEGRNHFGQGTMMGVFSLSMSCGVFAGAMMSGFGMDFLGIPWAFRLAGIGVILFSFIGGGFIRSAPPE